MAGPGRLRHLADTRSSRTVDAGVEADASVDYEQRARQFPTYVAWSRREERGVHERRSQHPVGRGRSVRGDDRYQFAEAQYDPGGGAGLAIAGFRALPR